MSVEAHVNADLPTSRFSPQAKVVALGLALLSLWSLAWIAPTPTPPLDAVRPAWWVVAVLSAFTELWVFRLWGRRQQQAIAIGEMIVVIGLFLLPPVQVLWARVLGGAVVLVFYRRQPPLKLFFNLAMLGAVAAVSCLVFHAVAQGATALDPRGWVAAVLGVLAGVLLDTMAMVLVLGWFEGFTTLASTARGALRGMAESLIATGLGLIAAVALALGSGAIPPLLVAVVVVLAGYRSYAVLAERHASLERLFTLSAGFHDARTVDQVASTTVRGAVDLLGATSGLLVLAQGEGRVSTWTLDGEAVPLRRTCHAGDPDYEELAALAAGGRGSGGEALGADLDVSGDVRGRLEVGERLTEWRGQRLINQRLLDTVANHATVSLRHALAVEQLTYDARHDKLTGLLNRGAFSDEADAVMAAVAAGRRPAVGILDLDGFKTLNDSIGHHAGDAVISEVGRRMRALADDRTVVARLGGDEFALLLRDADSDEDVLAVGRRLLACLTNDVDVDGRPVRLAGSLGLARAPRDGVDVDSLLRCADLAMYAAKRGSRGMAMYGRDMAHTSADPVALAADLRLALAKGELAVAVQPLIDLRSNNLHSVEVLARWRHPSLGLVEPETFVSAAERSGLGGELTRVMIEAALQACRAWLDEGLEVRVAVNLSARALDDEDLPDLVAHQLAENGVPGRLLSLELTESGLLDKPDRVIPVLTGLRALGVRLAIDDFGTGYSSMTYVSSLAPDQVKIDKSFVQRLPLRGRDAAIVQSIIDLGHNLNVEVVAEGVSDLATERAVRELGCALAQGFRFAEPMPWRALPGWLSRRDTSVPDAKVPSSPAGRGQVDPPDDGGSERLRLVR
ncbi:MAG: bifunctional diguanylate cyclase/phosphodiesterase [Kineosporiaceae bacterium]